MKTNISPKMEFTRLKARYSKQERLPEEEYSKILNSALSGDQKAIQKVVEAHYRLVLSIVDGYFNCKGVDLLDLVGEGTLALIQAISKYDPARGVRFSTFAYPFIKGAVSRFYHQNTGPISIESLRKKDLRKVAEAIEVCPNGSIGMIAKLAGISERAVRMCLPMVGGFVQIEAVKCPENLLQAEENLWDGDYPVEKLLNLIKKDSDRKIISMRFGVGGSQKATAQEIADEFGITTQYVYMLEAKIIQELRENISHMDESPIAV